LYTIIKQKRMISREDFVKKFNEDGFVIVPDVFNKEFCGRAKFALLDAIEKEKLNVPNKDYREYGLLLCSAIYGNEHPVFFEFFENKTFLQPFEWVLDKWFIVYIYSSACLSPNGGKLFTSDIHVDLPRLIEDYHTGVGAILCTDDFTSENGATWVLPGSHTQYEKPDKDYFYKNAIRLEAKAGTVFYFNPRLWHAAGQNHTDEWRTSLNVGMSRPWMKQRIDIPRFLASMGVNISSLPEQTLQLLGYYSQPPASMNDYFGERSERSYKQPFI
jgi:hypothetical protein